MVRLYDGNLAFADQEVGAIVSSLEQEGLLERTVVIVAADHGEELLEHGWIGHHVQVLGKGGSDREFQGRSALHAWTLRLARRGPGGSETAELTCEQCENLRSLGYIQGDCPRHCK
jgi:arylsulfatase A-like enzyme